METPTGPPGSLIVLNLRGGGGGGGDQEEGGPWRRRGDWRTGGELEAEGRRRVVYYCYFMKGVQGSYYNVNSQLIVSFELVVFGS